MSMKTAKKAKTSGPANPKDLGLAAIVYLPVAETLLTRHQIARLLSTSLRSFASMVSRGEYPRPDTHLGPQQPRWRAATHDTWVRKRCGMEG